MPGPTKKSQLQEVQKLLAQAAYQLTAEGDNWEKGYLALQNARAIICDLNGDIDGARSARRYAEHMGLIDKGVTIDQIKEGPGAYPIPR